MSYSASTVSASVAPPQEIAEIARTLGKILWDREFRQANPQASVEDRRAAWQAARKDYVKMGRQVAMRMQRAGLDITTRAAA